MNGKENTKREMRISAKYVHVTLHKLVNEDKDYWLKKAMTFRHNTVASLVGLEENHEEDKGLHAHIIIQFSTKQFLSRRQFTEHFGTDSLHIATKKDKQALLIGLGYVAKTGNSLQDGVFTHRGVELSTDPEVYRFNYQVETVDDAICYFQKAIKEFIESEEELMLKMADKDNAIGRYLVAKPTLLKSLQRLEHVWKFNHKNAMKKGFVFSSFVDNRKALHKAYKAYLVTYPSLFKEHLPTNSNIVLEADYNCHEVHDLEVLRKVVSQLKAAVKYRWKRPHKSLNLYLWSSKPSFGKTRLLRFLSEHMVAYRLPDDQYYTDYKNLCYEVLVSDEADQFISTKEYSHLKHIFEGENVEFNRKHKHKIFKRDNPLMVLAENVSFEELMKRRFPKHYNKEVMDTRMLDLELRSRATLHFFLDKCISNGVDEQLGLFPKEKKAVGVGT